MAAVVLMSCGSTSSLSNALSTAASANSTAKTMGSSCGSALVNLYKAYKANGKKINMSDANVWSNALALSSSMAGLKDNGRNSDYRKSYIAGMLLGSAGTLTQTSATNVYDNMLNSLGSLTGLSSSSSSTAKSNAASALSTILGLMGN